MTHQKAVNPSSLYINLTAWVRLRYLEEIENWREEKADNCVILLQIPGMHAL